MKQINLLPYNDQKRHLLKRLLSAGGVGMVAGLATAGILAMALQTELVRLQEQAVSKSTSSVQAKGLAENPDLKTRVLQLNTLSKNEVQWPRAFSVVNSLIPSDIRLTNYSYGSASSGLSLKLSGTAASNVSFASFVQGLKTNKSLTGLKVESYAYVPASGSVTFALSVTVPLAAVDYSTPKPGSL